MFEIRDEHSLWVEAYRPVELEDYVGNDEIKNKVAEYIDKQDIPHLLLVNHNPGTGKTTLAKLIAKKIDSDVLYINASDEGGIDFIRNTIIPFASTIGFSPLKIVILDEADGLTPQFQSALRNTMETYSKHCRFILTCNYRDKLIKPVQSRCQVFEIIPPKKEDVKKRIETILKKEKITFSNEDLVKLVDENFPDIRQIINEAQRQINHDNILALSKNKSVIQNYQELILKELKNGDKKKAFENIRQIISDSRLKHFDNLFRFLFDYVDEYGKGHIANIILLIHKYQFECSLVVDKEPGIMSLFIEILNELNQK